jgi:hypothetical protein
MIYPQLLVLLALAAGSLPVPAATWYAAIDGKGTNGTYTDPWSVEMAVGKQSNLYLKPGDTVIFKGGGTYVCTDSDSEIAYGKQLIFRISGTPSEKIIYKAEHLWQFHFDGGLLMPSTTSNLVVRDFHVYYSGSTNRNMTNYLDYSCGISVFSPGVDIMHNLIENTGHPGIGSWSCTRGKYIAGNIVRFIGINDWTVGYNGGARGSGMYLQNANNSAEALVQGNLSYFNYTTGIKAYGNDNIWGLKFLQNICAENNEAGIFYHQDKTDSQGFQMVSNYIWKGNPGLRVGWQLGNANPSNAVVVGNYVVDTNVPITMVDGWKNTTWMNNVAVNPWRRLVWELGLASETNSSSGHTMSGNQYWGGAYTGLGTESFLYYGAQKTFAQWQALGVDSNSVNTAGTPNNITVYAYKPSRDPNFVHVSVFNWPTNSQTAVDLSGYFKSGDLLKIFDAQELPFAYTNFTYAGGTVWLELNRTNIAEMMGTFHSRQDEWTGFDRRFRAFVIYRYGSSSTAGSLLPASQLHVLY